MSLLSEINHKATQLCCLASATALQHGRYLCFHPENRDISVRVRKHILLTAMLQNDVIGDKIRVQGMYMYRQTAS